MELSRRRIQIANGEKGHSKEVINKYIKQWELEGFDVSELKDEPIKISTKVSDKKIILLEAFHIGHGGVERWIVDLIKNYPEKDIEWRVWSKDSNVHSKIYEEEIKKIANLYLGSDKLREACLNIDLCIACGYFTNDFYKGKTIAVAHGEDHFYEECMDNLSFCQYRVGTSKTAQNIFKEKESTLIYNGVDLNRCFPKNLDIKSQLGLPDDKLILLSLCRLELDKRVWLAMEAAEILGAYLLIVGAGSQEKNLRQFAKNLNFEDYRFLGFQTEIGDYLSIADLMLVTSTQESFCLAGGEAAIAGVPIVATPVGLFTERDDFYKVSYDPKSSEYKEIIPKAIADTETTNRLRNYYLDNFNINNFVGNWKKYIDIVLEDN